jgi:hypothetical protein
MMSWRDWAAAQYNHVLSIMRDTMDKTLFIRPTTEKDRVNHEAVWDDL